MRKLLLAVLLLPALLLGGCASYTQLENQSFALSIAIDRTEQGELTISVQMPTNGAGGGGQSEDGGGSSSEYLLASATAPSYSEALDLLQATVQRKLNLAQLKTVCVSAQVASEADFRLLLREIVMTNQLYSAAQFVVCAGKAQTLISEQMPYIGVRLSSTLVSALENYHARGYIPYVTLADMYYLTQSVYGDPVAIFAATADGTHFRAMPEGRLGDAYAGALPRSGQNKNEYFGSALFRDGQMVGVLTGRETMFLNVLRGERDTLSYMHDGIGLRLLLHRAPAVSVDVSGDRPRIEVTLAMSVETVGDMPELETLKSAIWADLNALTARCQSLSVDPFGYAEYAAARFLTFYQWQSYDWRNRFPTAEIAYRVELT